MGLTMTPDLAGRAGGNGPVRIGSRRSELALWQTNHVRGLLQTAWPELLLDVVTFDTRGDQVLDTPLPLIGDKGLFTAELEAALHVRTIDAAVHSLKDLPTEMPDGLTVGAITSRVNPADVVVSREEYTLDTLPLGAAVGTSSRRRAAQLLALRPDLRILDIRGNVPNRIRKALDLNGPYDAVVLAYSGLARLGRLEVVSQVLDPARFLPAPGQGALGVQCRDETASLALVQPLDDELTRIAVTAERAFLAGLGGGCAVPIAAYAVVDKGQLQIHGRVSALDGTRQIDVQISGTPAAAAQLGADLARNRA